MVARIAAELSRDGPGMTLVLEGHMDVVLADVISNRLKTCERYPDLPGEGVQG